MQKAGQMHCSPGACRELTLRTTPWKRPYDSLPCSTTLKFPLDWPPITGSFCSDLSRDRSAERLTERLAEAGGRPASLLREQRDCPCNAPFVVRALRSLLEAGEQELLLLANRHRRSQCHRGCEQAEGAHHLLQ